MRKLFSLPLVILIAGLVAAGCGDNGGESARVRVQLDWVPNTNHIGVYVALAQGWYREAGLEVEVLPYSDANADVVVANGNADVGFSFPPNVIFSRAAGLDLVSIAAVLQRNVTELAVLASSSISRPRDLDGKTYAGFGLPYEEPQIKTVIKADGGKGDFRAVTLTTAAYEALYNGRADFTEIFTTWEGIQAQLRGIPLRTFRYDQYGVPDFHGVVLVARRQSLQTQGEQLRKFLEITRRGYEFAASQPQQAAQVLLDYLPKETFPEPEMVRRSADMLAKIFLAPDGRWGSQSAEKWSAYTNWIVGSGIVKDGRGNPVRGMDTADLFTNQLLEGR
ncbi:MAG TPA: ABC transporter substrate-binding protein [Dehalococcoidia bacterium]|nr:ABC transporter substrate-binding protein [Dehalococcoidia bacterium]